MNVGYIDSIRSCHIYKDKDGKFYCYNRLCQKSKLYDSLMEITHAILSSTVRFGEKLYFRPKTVLSQSSFTG